MVYVADRLTDTILLFMYGKKNAMTSSTEHGDMPKLAKAQCFTKRLATKLNRDPSTKKYLRKYGDELNAFKSSPKTSIAMEIRPHIVSTHLKSPPSRPACLYIQPRDRAKPALPAARRRR